MHARIINVGRRDGFAQGVAHFITGKQRGGGLRGIRAVQRDLQNAALAGGDAAPGRFHQNVADRGIRARQGGRHDATAPNADNRYLGQLPGHRIELHAVHIHQTRPPVAGVYIAVHRFHRHIAAIVGRDPRAVNIHIPLGEDGNAPAALGEDALGQAVIPHRGGVVPHIQRTPDREVDVPQIAGVGYLGCGHAQIAGRGDIDVRALRGDGRQRGIRRISVNPAGNPQVNARGGDLEMSRPGNPQPLVIQRGRLGGRVKLIDGGRLPAGQGHWHVHSVAIVIQHGIAVLIQLHHRGILQKGQLRLGHHAHEGERASRRIILKFLRQLRQAAQVVIQQFRRQRRRQRHTGQIAPVGDSARDADRGGLAGRQILPGKTKVVCAPAHGDLRKGRHGQVKRVNVPGDIHDHGAGIIRMQRRVAMPQGEGGVVRRIAVGHRDARQRDGRAVARQAAAVPSGDIQRTLAGGIQNHRIIERDPSGAGVQAEFRRVYRGDAVWLRARSVQRDGIPRPQIKGGIRRVIKRERIIGVQRAAGIADFAKVNVIRRPDIPRAADQAQVYRDGRIARRRVTHAGVRIQRGGHLAVGHGHPGQNRASAIGHLKIPLHQIPGG